MCERGSHHSSSAILIVACVCVRAACVCERERGSHHSTSAILIAACVCHTCLHLGTTIRETGGGGGGVSMGKGQCLFARNIAISPVTTVNKAVQHLTLKLTALIFNQLNHSLLKCKLYLNLHV